jgi:hypothetical protein
LVIARAEPRRRRELLEQAVSSLCDFIPSRNHALPVTLPALDAAIAGGLRGVAGDGPRSKEDSMKFLSAAILVAFTSALAFGAVAQTAAPTQPQPGPSVGEPAQQAMTQTEKDARSALEKAGYTRIRDVKSTRDGVTAKAMKDGKDMSVVVDTSGEIKAMP